MNHPKEQPLALKQNALQGFYHAGTKVRITKSEISMRTWRSPMSAAPQGAFVVIPEISHSDISYIIKQGVTRHIDGRIYDNMFS